MDDGLFPYTRRYLGTLRNHFSTIGINGVNEMVRNFTRGVSDISSPDGHAQAIRLLDFLRERMRGYQEQTGNLYNLQQRRPRERPTASREDKKRYHDILQAGTDDTPYYTNSTQLPVGFTDDPFEALLRQDELQTLHRRHGAASLHARTHLTAGCLPQAGAGRLVEVPPAVHHRHANLLDLSETRLSQQRTRILSALRRGSGRPAWPRATGRHANLSVSSAKGSS